MSDTYRTIETEGSATIKRKGSRFLAEAVPTRSRSQTEGRVTTVRKRENKASHHCSAYRLGVSGDTFHYDDDGEPSGTAGPPILREIDARDLTNVLVVVTRYFGETELGTGGLARAYGEAASIALDRADIVEKVVRVPIRVQFAYDDTSPVQLVLRRFDTTVQARDFTAVTELTVGVRASEVNSFLEAFTNALSDRGEILWVGDGGDA